ncbi:hypothetical protein [Streptomyces sp. NPDC056549]|uniref:hypothetical protein n=1 Tax=Streptomyces sp. NPDC056549 TaxID=3345864 RepID=UPI0036AF5914
MAAAAKEAWTRQQRLPVSARRPSAMAWTLGPGAVMRGAPVSGRAGAARSGHTEEALAGLADDCGGLLDLVAFFLGERVDGLGGGTNTERSPV